MLVNDVSLRNLIPAELAKGFGFLQSKPASSFSPVAVTPDELGDAWRGGKVHLPLVSHVNGALFGRPDAGVDMTFPFGRLIAHLAKTRDLAAGTIVGSGTVSNREDGGPGRPAAAGGVGYSCIAEQRTVETIVDGSAGDAVPALRRPRAHRDARRRRAFDLRRDRPARPASRLAGRGARVRAPDSAEPCARLDSFSTHRVRWRRSFSRGSSGPGSATSGDWPRSPASSRGAVTASRSACSTSSARVRCARPSVSVPAGAGGVAGAVVVRSRDESRRGPGRLRLSRRGGPGRAGARLALDAHVRQGGRARGRFRADGVARRAHARDSGGVDRTRLFDAAGREAAAELQARGSGSSRDDLADARSRRRRDREPGAGRPRDRRRSPTGGNSSPDGRSLVCDWPELDCYARAFVARR